MSNFDNDLSSPLHDSSGHALDDVAENEGMQRSAMPPPFQLKAAEASEDTGESEMLQLTELGGGEGFATVTPPPPSANALTNSKVVQRTDGEVPVEGSSWTGKAARVTSEGYRVRSERDSSATPTHQLAFNTWVHVENEWPGDWLEIITENGAHGFVGIPNSNLLRLPDADPSATVHNVESGQTAIGIAEQYFSGYVRQGMDLRYYVAVIAQLNGIDIPDSVSGWRNTQINADEPLFIPSLQYALSQEDIVNTGSYSQEAIDFITETADLIRQVSSDVMASVEIAQTVISEGWRNAVAEGVRGAIEDKIRELLRRLLIVAGTTAVGALVGALVGGAGAAPGAAIGYDIGLMIVNGIELIEMIQSIGTIMVTFATALGEYGTLVFEARGDEEKIAQAGQVMGQAVLFAIQILVEELVSSGQLSPDGPSTVDGPSTIDGTTPDGPSTIDGTSPEGGDVDGTTQDGVTQDGTTTDGVIVPPVGDSTTSGGTNGSPAIISNTVETRVSSAGFRQATEMGLPAAPVGHIWVAGPDMPHLRRSPGYTGPRRVYDPATGTITDVASSNISTRAAIVEGSQTSVDHSDLPEATQNRLAELEQQRNDARNRRDEAEQGTSEYNQASQDMRNASESIGMEAAEAGFMQQHPGAQRLNFDLLGTSAGVFDLVFNVNGQIYIVEAKGGSSPTLGTRATPEGRVQQGTSPYQSSIVESMRGRLNTMMDAAESSGDTSRMLEIDSQLTNLSLIDSGAIYLLAHQRIDANGNITGSVNFSQFDTSGQ